MAENPMLRIADIRRDGGTQAREGIRQAAVNEYTAALRDGETFPPVVVFNDGETLWLADGFHRVAAALNAGLEEIAAEIKEGTIHEAKWYAMGANKGHGERMSNADKRHAVRMALEDEELSQKSTREIAEQCRVSHTLVETLKRESGNGCQIDQYSLNEKISDSKGSEIERLEKELANREEYEKKWEAEIEATIAERVQEELVKQSGQPNDEPPRDEELERLRQEIAERDESERQLREELAKRPEQPQDEEIERLRRELAGQEEARLEQEERSRRIENEMEALKNGDHPDIEAIVEERVQQATPTEQSAEAAELPMPETRTLRKCPASIPRTRRGHTADRLKTFAECPPDVRRTTCGRPADVRWMSRGRPPLRER